MAIDWGAFVKGWAGSAADNIKEREKEARDKKMMEQLADLQEKYKIKEEKRAEERAKRKVDKDLSYIDYATGQRVFTNSEGEELRREAAPASALEDRTLDVEGRKLKLEDTRSAIASRAAGDRNDAIRTANDGSRTRATIESLRAERASEAGGGIEGVAGKNLVSRLAVDIVKQSGIKSEEREGGLSQRQIMTAATRASQTAIASGKGYDAALPLFLDELTSDPKVKRPITRGVRGR